MMINKGAVAATAVAVVVGMTVIRDKVIVSVGLDYYFLMMFTMMMMTIQPRKFKSLSGKN